MAKANGSTIMVNTKAKKRTHILIKDNDGRFDDTKPTTTKVTGVTAGGGTIIFTVNPPRIHSKKTLTVIIHSPKSKGKPRRFTDPTSEMLVVTITTGATATTVPVDTIPILMIDDPDGCDEP